MPKITTHFVETQLALPSSQQIIVRDSELRGFGMRVTSSGARSYVAETRVNGRMRRVTIGHYATMTPDEARVLANRLLLEMSAGRHPGSRRQRVVTLQEVLDRYLSLRPLRPRTAKSYRYNKSVRRSRKTVG